jgi:predicted alpha/beta-hydrolase family hydrolase
VSEAAPQRKPRARRWGLIGLAGFVPLVLLMFAVWAFVAMGPAEEAEYALMGGLSHDVVQLPDGITFAPLDGPGEAGVIIYPGAKVDPRSYAPIAADLAEEGVLVVIAPMRFNLAILSPDRAATIIDAWPEVDTWVVVGHSLGGVAACTFADDAPDAVDGLVLLAAFPGPEDDLSDQDLAVVSLLGTEDGLVDPAEYEAAKDRLPADTTHVGIDGGNHAQFGSYGPQNGDREATITAAEQQAEVVEAALGMLETLGALTTE